jgi:hypothetical protein
MFDSILFLKILVFSIKQSETTNLFKGGNTLSAAAIEKLAGVSIFVVLGR